MRKYVLLLLVLTTGALLQAQVRYIFRNSSAVNQQSYADDEIYIYTQLAMPGMNGYFNTGTQTWENINNAPNMAGPNGGNYTDANARLDQLPVNADGQYYLDLPQGSTGRIYIGFGGQVYTWGANNPLLDAPGNPNYYTKIETIELTIGGQIFTNTSRVDRYAYPIGEELYCNNGAYYDKVGETVTHEQVIAKWKLFANDEFQNAYDPVRDIIEQMGHASYFQEGNPGNDYFDEFIDELFVYFSTRTLRAEWRGEERTGTVVGNQLIWSDGTVFNRDEFHLEDIVGGVGAFNQGTGQILGVCFNRGVIQLTEDLQVWDDEDNYFQNPVKNDYTHFFHSDFVSHNAQTYALAYDDVFDYSSTQSCQGTPDSVVIWLGGYGTEHVQVLSDVYITPLDPEVDQYRTIDLGVMGLDQGLIDFEIPDDAVVSWTIVNPNGQEENGLIDEDGTFGPTDVRGDYEVTVSVSTGGETFEATTTVTVNQAGTTGEVCTGPAGDRADYQLEVIGSRVYLTLIPNDAWVDGGYARLHYGATNDLGDMPANVIIPNQAYHLNGFFMGEEVYFYLFSELNGGTTVGNPEHIESIGTCQGLEILEEIISISSTENVNIDVSESYQVPLSGATNKGNTVDFPDALFVEDIVYSGLGVDALGLFTPVNGSGVYPIEIEYDGILIEITITVTGDDCESEIEIENQEVCVGEVLEISLPNGPFSNVAWTGDGATFLRTTDEEVVQFIHDEAGIYLLEVSAIDGSGCDASGSFEVEVKNLPELTLPVVEDQCLGGDVIELVYVQASVDIEGGTYTWSTNVSPVPLDASQAIFAPLEEGVVTVSLEYTVDGCSSPLMSTDINVVEGEKLSITYSYETTCAEGEIMTPTVSYDGGTFEAYPTTDALNAQGAFDPSLAPAGDYLIIYDYSGTTCPAIADSFLLTINDQSSIDFTGFPSEACESELLDLPELVAGGVYTGLGVDNGTLDASVLNTETASILFTYTDTTTSCGVDSVLEISLTPAPELSGETQNISANVSEQELPEFCSTSDFTNWYNDASITDFLAQQRCLAVNFEDADDDGFMDVGTYTIYAVANDGSCSGDTAEFILTVDECLGIDLPASVSICEGGSESILISDTDLSNITFEGTGETYLTEESEGEFLFSSTTAGEYEISFSGERADGCVASGTLTLIVDEKPVVELFIDESVCENAEAITLEASPLGGLFSGEGVTNGVFDPLLVSTSNSVELSYEYTDPSTGCVADRASIDVSIIRITAPEALTLQALSSGISNQDELPELCSEGIENWYNGANDLLVSASCYSFDFIDLDNNQTMDAGTYTVYSAIAQEGCVSELTEHRLIVTDCETETPIVSFAEVRTCEGEELPVLSLQNVGDNYEWTIVQNSSVIGRSSTIDLNDFTEVLLPGNSYDLSVSFEQMSSTGEACRGLSSSVSILIDPLPTVEILGEEDYCSAETVSLSAFSNENDLSYQWSTNDDSESITFEAVEDTEVLVFVTNNEGCEASESKKIHVHELDDYELLSVDTILCDGETTTLSFSSVVADDVTIRWYRNTELLSFTEDEIIVDAEGVYHAEFENEYACTSISSSIDILEETVQFEAYATKDTVALEESFALIATSANLDLQYLWQSDSDVFEGEEIELTIEAPTSFVVTATGSRCNASDTIDVVVLEPVKIPNGFSPNGDGKNDTWEIPGLKFSEEIDLVIIDRLGHVVFEASDYETYWDGINKNGDELNTGTYFYRISVMGEEDYSGDVTIIR